MEIEWNDTGWNSILHDTGEGCSGVGANIDSSARRSVNAQIDHNAS